jgi:hypothetical protein
VDVGGESLILGPGAVVFRGRDIEPRNSGQGGFQVKLKSGDTEYGFYAAQFHDKMPQFYARPGVNVQAGSVGDYVMVYAENIRTVGASVSTLVGRDQRGRRAVIPRQHAPGGLRQRRDHRR